MRGHSTTNYARLQLHRRSSWISTGKWTFDVLITLHFGTFKLTYSQTKGRKLHNIITHNAIWAHTKTESLRFCWQLALATENKINVVNLVTYLKNCVYNLLFNYRKTGFAALQQRTCLFAVTDFDKEPMYFTVQVWMPHV